MNVTDVHKGVTKNKKRNRIGRGPGSGHGRTAGRGNKGHRARAGFSCPVFAELGKTPLIRRIPKRGFTNAFAKIVAIVNVADLEDRFDAGDEVNGETLKAKGLCGQPHDVIKVLGDGELTKRLKVSAHRFSESAKEKIAKAGGEVIVVPGPKPVVDREESDNEQAAQKRSAKKQAIRQRTTKKGTAGNGSSGKSPTGKRSSGKSAGGKKPTGQQS